MDEATYIYEQTESFLDSLILQMIDSLTYLVIPNDSEDKLADMLDLAMRNGLSTQVSDYINQNYAAIHSTASLCPVEYGPAVHWARVLLSQEDSTAYLDDLCSTSALRGESSIVIDKLKVIPNPNDGTFLLQHSVEIGKRAHCAIYNSNGVKIKSIIILPGLEKHFLDVGNAPKGVYFIKVQEDNRVKNGSFIVQ